MIVLICHVKYCKYSVAFFNECEIIKISVVLYIYIYIHIYILSFKSAFNRDVCKSEYCVCKLLYTESLTLETVFDENCYTRMAHCAYCFKLKD